MFSWKKFKKVSSNFLLHCKHTIISSIYYEMPSLQMRPSVKCWWHSLSHRGRFGSLRLWPGCRAQPPPALQQLGQHSHGPGQALLWTHATSQPGCWPAGLSTACVQLRQNFSLSIKSLSLLLKTPHIGTKYTTGYYSALTRRLCLPRWECGQCRRHTNPIKEKAL